MSTKWFFNWHPIWVFLHSGTLLSYVALGGIGLLAIAAMFFLYDDFKCFMETGGFLSLIGIIILVIIGPITIIAAILFVIIMLYGVLGGGFNSGNNGNSRR